MGVFSKIHENGLVKPLMKNPSLGCKLLNNYRPVSSLKLLSNIIERATLFI